MSDSQDSTRPAPPKGGATGCAEDGGFGAAVWAAVVVIALMWGVLLINIRFFNGDLNSYGLRPRDPESLRGILVAPLLNDTYESVIYATGTMVLLSGLIAFSSRRLWCRVTFIVTLISGLGTWLIGPAGTQSAGVTGVAYGWLAFLLFRTFCYSVPGKNTSGQAVMAFTGGTVSGMFTDLLTVSSPEGVSGAISGILAVLLCKRYDPGASA